MKFSFLFCRTGCGIPANGIRKFLEVRTRRKRLAEVLRIFNNSCDDKPLIAIRTLIAIVVFGEQRVRAVWSTVLAEVSRPHVSRHNFQTAAARRSAAGTFPLRDGISLPHGGTVGTFGCVEAEQTGLCSSIGIDAKRVVVFPQDMQPADRKST